MAKLDITPRCSAQHLERVLVPLDGSDASREAIPYAAAFGAGRLTLLRVLAGEEPGEGGALDFFANWRRGQMDELEAEMNHLVEEHRDAAATVDWEVRYGDPAGEIIATSETCDLVAMSSKGRGTIGRAVFGSVADRVVRYAERPTLVTRVDDTPITDAFPTRVMVPLDGSERAEQALPLATRLAATWDVAIHLVRVVGMDEILATVRRDRRSEPAGSIDHSAGDPYDVARAVAEREATDYLDDVAAQLREAGYDVITEMRGGTPTFELLWATGTDDLVVMTSRGYGGHERWLIGSVAEKLIRESEAPVVIVPMMPGASGDA